MSSWFIAVSSQRVHYISLARARRRAAGIGQTT
jgi:hypothetical protein